MLYNLPMTTRAGVDAVGMLAHYMLDALVGHIVVDGANTSRIRMHRLSYTEVASKIFKVHGVAHPSCFAEIIFWNSEYSQWACREGA